MNKVTESLLSNFTKHTSCSIISNCLNGQLKVCNQEELSYFAPQISEIFLNQLGYIK